MRGIFGGTQAIYGNLDAMSGLRGGCQNLAPLVKICELLFMAARGRGLVKLRAFVTRAGQPGRGALSARIRRFYSNYF